MFVLMDLLRKAIEDERHSSEGWHAPTLCDGLANLVANDTNLMNAVSHLSPDNLFGVIISALATGFYQI